MALVVWIIAPCILISKTGWRIIGLFLATIGLFQLLTLLLLASEVCSSGCTKLGIGGIISIVSGVLWLVSCILCFFVGEPNEREIPIATGTPISGDAPTSQSTFVEQTEQTTSQQHVEKDGTVVIETTTTRADGSVIVTTEVIPPGTAVASTVF